MKLAKSKLVVAISAALLLSPQLACATSLMQAYQAALKNDPSYRGAKADRVAGQEYEVIGRSGLLPSVQYSYSVSKNKGETYADFFGTVRKTDQDYSSLSKGVTVRQTIFNLDAYAQFDSRSAELIVRLVGAYADANYALDQINLYSAQRDTLREQRKINDRLFEKGEGTKTDMLETQAKLDLAEATLLEANDGLQAALSVLTGIIGSEVTQLDRLVENFQPMMVDGSFEDWKKTALQNNPEVISARHAVEIAEQEIAKNRAGHLPRIDLNASYNHGVSETITTKNQDNNIRTIGVQLVIPLYSGGYVNAAYRQSVARLERAKADLDSTLDKLNVELKRQHNASRTSLAKIEAMQRSIKSAELLVEATKQSVKGGVRINADLLNAEQQLVLAKRDLASARYNHLISYIKLRAAAGVLTSDDVNRVAAFFAAQ